MTKRAALYLRISKDDAQTGLAVERQRDECMKVIREHGLDLVETYTDNGVSAYNRNVRRPAFDKMTRDYQAGRFDVVVCWDIDRFSRQPLQLEQWIDLGAERGLRILTPSESTDLTTDNGRLFARMKASIARAEVERKSTRQKAQALQAKANGTYKARIGFNDAEVVRRIFAAILAGEGVYKVARALNDDGLRTVRGVLWSGQAVRRIILTPRHRGALISEANYDKAAALVSQGVRVGAKATGKYSGVARCSTCDASMTASGDRYVCAFATNHPGAKGHQVIARHRLEEPITDAMVAAFAFGREVMVHQVTDVTDIEADLARVAEARRRIVGLVGQDLISERDAERELRTLKQRGDSLDALRAAAIAESAHLQMLDGLVSGLLLPGRVSVDAVVEMKAKVRERWESLDPDNRRMLAREFLTVTILPKEHKERVSITHRVVVSLNDDDDAALAEESAA